MYSPSSSKPILKLNTQQLDLNSHVKNNSSIDRASPGKKNQSYFQYFFLIEAKTVRFYKAIATRQTLIRQIMIIMAQV